MLQKMPLDSVISKFATSPKEYQNALEQEEKNGVQQLVKIGELLKSIYTIKSGIDASHQCQFIINLANLFITKFQENSKNPSSTEQQSLINLAKSFTEHLHLLLKNPFLQAHFAKKGLIPLDVLLSSLTNIISNASGVTNKFSAKQLVGLIISAESYEVLESATKAASIAAIGALAPAAGFGNTQFLVQLDLPQPKEQKKLSAEAKADWMMGLGELAKKSLLKDLQPARLISQLLSSLLLDNPSPKTLLKSITSVADLVAAWGIKDWSNAFTPELFNILRYLGDQSVDAEHSHVQILVQMKEFYLGIPHPRPRIAAEAICHFLKKILENPTLTAKEIALVFLSIGKLMEAHHYTIVELNPLLALSNHAFLLLQKKPQLTTQTLTNMFYAFVLMGLWDKPTGVIKNLFEKTLSLLTTEVQKKPSTSLGRDQKHLGSKPTPVLPEVAEPGLVKAITQFGQYACLSGQKEVLLPFQTFLEKNRPTPSDLQLSLRRRFIDKGYSCQCEYLGSGVLPGDILLITPAGKRYLIELDGFFHRDYFSGSAALSPKDQRKEYYFRTFEQTPVIRWAMYKGKKQDLDKIEEHILAEIQRIENPATTASKAYENKIEKKQVIADPSPTLVTTEFIPAPVPIAAEHSSVPSVAPTPFPTRDDKKKSESKTAVISFTLNELITAIEAGNLIKIKEILSHTPLAELLKDKPQTAVVYHPLHAALHCYQTADTSQKSQFLEIIKELAKNSSITALTQSQKDEKNPLEMAVTLNQKEVIEIFIARAKIAIKKHKKKSKNFQLFLEQAQSALQIAKQKNLVPIIDCLKTAGVKELVAEEKLPAASHSHQAISLEFIYHGGCIAFKDNDFKKAVELWTLAANQGHTEAHYSLGNYYENATSIAEHLSLAITWYGKAAQSGHLAAQQALNKINSRQLIADSLGDSHLAMDLTSDSKTTSTVTVLSEVEESIRQEQKIEQKEIFEVIKISNAEEFIRARLPHASPTVLRKLNFWAENKNDCVSHFTLGLVFLEGWAGVIINFEEAYYHFLQAAQQGNPESQYYVGVCIAKGHGTNQDPNQEEGVNWILRAAKNGHPESQYLIGKGYILSIHLPDYLSLAASWMLKAAKRDHSEAQLYMSRFHTSGEGGVRKDLEQAFYWRGRSAMNGCAVAQFEFYCECAEKQDHKKAFEWALMAAKNKKPLAGAQFIVSRYYFNGVGIGKSITEGWYWAQESARNGDSDGQLTVGDILVYGRHGVVQNRAEGIKWIRAAIKNKHPAAQARLDIIMKSTHSTLAQLGSPLHQKPVPELKTPADSDKLSGPADKKTVVSQDLTKLPALVELISKGFSLVKIEKVLKELHEKTDVLGDYMNATGGDKQTALHMAASTNDEKLCNVLLRYWHGIDYELVDSSGRTALQCALPGSAIAQAIKLITESEFHDSVPHEFIDATSASAPHYLIFVEKYEALLEPFEKELAKIKEIKWEADRFMSGTLLEESEGIVEKIVSLYDALLKYSKGLETEELTKKTIEELGFSTEEDSIYQAAQLIVNLPSNEVGKKLLQDYLTATREVLEIYKDLTPTTVPKLLAEEKSPGELLSNLKSDAKSILATVEPYDIASSQQFTSSPECVELSPAFSSRIS